MTLTVSVLGATGSIGRSTADLLDQHRDRFRVGAVAGGRDAQALARVARELNAEFAAIADPEAGPALRDALSGSGIACGAGPSAVIEAATREADIVVAAVSGAAGLSPTCAAIRQGRTVALANKESLVCAGDAFMRDAKKYGARLLPMDSEHNALEQSIGTGRIDDITRMTITASGGPFRTATRERIAAASAADAAAHPTWSMGMKINIDSATLMNKGLELIEAHHLFGIEAERLDAVVHPQSIVHALVTWRDGAVTAGLYVPDMRVPISHCLGLGDRLSIARGKPLDLASVGSLTFERPDEERFPCLRIAKAALAAGGAQPTVMNAANEIAVAAFIAGRIGFYDIAALVERACEHFAARFPEAPADVEEALAIDAEVRGWSTAALAA
ncbi:1-deoxy-D-xylulose 5-phosphate reductoisomerase [Methylobacterium indicum]|uniref:1-deoxy-D-xylulose 5-phosphate reductoisomerase n=1 Tax=Methylobacterium indicum TaxID=1775910 RepID=A0A8H9C6U4_9HYPH|nr:1-deoxy-D-xylulose-5-phosphate reductoisomerase [Methylobacterium indicum]KTS36952.1 1-deoxy-D-xylulose 5-phosphate reductoisomerase [Methylobacterium indicum]KTS41384.1 1-deoxy-D-xylulose 5-phosphate reductoisomerase [Methylobacterium indicum]KTS53731.1 1-deoxy-D-xylulose 5-phosphate reductoisomerase [Methylobacterium indicum]BCM85592.1 1-deoxy-D-xylulose 5-phosphate reductoisomerase [Methylobacterium indicum]